MAVKAGKVQYTGRAFEQDASQAMGGDIVRALVELITNADDAYGANDGEINVEVLRTDGEPTRLIIVSGEHEKHGEQDHENET